jgi:hypothetical protein
MNCGEREIRGGAFGLLPLGDNPERAHKQPSAQQRKPILQEAAAMARVRQIL